MNKLSPYLQSEHSGSEFLSTFSVSPYGTLCILWRETAAQTRIHRIMLPEANRADGCLTAGELRPPAITKIIMDMEHFLQGHDVRFDLNILALDQCPPFQQRVLLAEAGIPRGWISTYGRIAGRVGVPGGARAVGHALATNPFPIIIPCHRAIRSDGRLGGFQGGLTMKRRLLELEGIQCSPEGRILTDRIYY